MTDPILWLPRPYLLFLGDTVEATYAKTAFGLRDWAPDQCVGEFACEGGTVTTGLPSLTPAQAHAKGARGLVIGVANEGGFIAETWIPALLHGSQPDVVVICHEPGRDCVIGHPEYALPSIEETIDLALRLGRRTNPAIRCTGVSLNTAQMDAPSAERLMQKESERLGLAVADPMRGGTMFDRLVSACLAQ